MKYIIWRLTNGDWLLCRLLVLADWNTLITLNWCNVYDHINKNTVVWLTDFPAVFLLHCATWGLNVAGDLRATLHLHGSNLVVAPAHGLQRGVVVVYLPLASHEVLPLKQHHLGLLVVLCAHGKTSSLRVNTHKTLQFVHLQLFSVTLSFICIIVINSDKLSS